MPDFIAKVLTPTGRAVLGFVQLAVYIGTGVLIAYHFAGGHQDAQAAQTALAPAAAIVRNNTTRVERKVDRAIDSINDIRQDINVIMDRLNIPQGQRATPRHAIPASSTTQDE